MTESLTHFFICLGCFCYGQHKRALPLIIHETDVEWLVHQQWDCYSAEALLSTHCYRASSDACHSTPIAPVCTACMTHSYTALQALPVRQTTSMHRRPITTTLGCVTLKKKLLETSGRMQGGASDEDGVPLQNGICLSQREKRKRPLL